MLAGTKRPWERLIVILAPAASSPHPRGARPCSSLGTVINSPLSFVLSSTIHHISQFTTNQISIFLSSFIKPQSFAMTSNFETEPSPPSTPSSVMTHISDSTVTQETQCNRITDMVLRSAWASTANWLLLQRAPLRCRTSSLGEGFSLQLYIDSCRTRGLEFGKVSNLSSFTLHAVTHHPVNPLITSDSPSITTP